MELYLITASGDTAETVLKVVPIAVEDRGGFLVSKNDSKRFEKHNIGVVLKYDEIKECESYIGLYGYVLDHGDIETMQKEMLAKIREHFMTWIQMLTMALEKVERPLIR